MSLPKRKGRKRVLVEGESYYWLQSQMTCADNPTISQGQYLIWLLIEPCERPATRLRAAVSLSGQVLHSLTAQKKPLGVPPPAVASIIRYALATGWAPRDGHDEFMLEHAEAVCGDSLLGA